MQKAFTLLSICTLQRHKVNLEHIESRSSHRSDEYEFIIELHTMAPTVGKALDELKEKTTYFQIISRNYKDNAGKATLQNIRDIVIRSRTCVENKTGPE